MLWHTKESATPSAKAVSVRPAKNSCYLYGPQWSTNALACHGIHFFKREYPAIKGNFIDQN